VSEAKSWPTTVGGAQEWTGVPGETRAERVERIRSWAEAADEAYGTGLVSVPIEEIRWLTAFAAQAASRGTDDVLVDELYDLATTPGSAPGSYEADTVIAWTIVRLRERGWVPSSE
jgi:hypothetical protein